jgi:hypothetical protein
VNVQRAQGKGYWIDCDERILGTGHDASRSS